MRAPTATSEIKDGEYLCTRIRRAEQALTAHHEAALRRHGLTMTQYAVLLALSRDGGMSGTQLARACGVTQQSMASVLTTLQDKALIDRAPSPVHGKVVIATLAKPGHAVLQKAYREVLVLERAFAEVFSEKEHATLCALLDRATAELIRQTSAGH